ncbi:unnamed protein product, partial [Ectocarpus sp. 4 AP-2014]
MSTREQQLSVEQGLRLQVSACGSFAVVFFLIADSDRLKEWRALRKATCVFEPTNSRRGQCRFWSDVFLTVAALALVTMMGEFTCHFLGLVKFAVATFSTPRRAYFIPKPTRLHPTGSQQENSRTARPAPMLPHPRRSKRPPGNVPEKIPCALASTHLSWNHAGYFVRYPPTC